MARELVSRYGAVAAGPKHAHRAEALALLGRGVEAYRWIAGVRHPMDEAVSRYSKVASNHRGRYTDPRAFSEHGGSVRRGGRERYEFLHRTQADFSAYFLRFHRQVQVSPWVGDQRRADLVIRFEDIQEGFSELLRLVGLDQQRPLPRLNATAGRTADYLGLYGPAIRRRAVTVLGPAMLEWGYRWPEDWGIAAVPRLSLLAYRLDSALGPPDRSPLPGLAKRASTRLRGYAARRP